MSATDPGIAMCPGCGQFPLGVSHACHGHQSTTFFAPIRERTDDEKLDRLIADVALLKVRMTPLKLVRCQACKGTGVFDGNGYSRPAMCPGCKGAGRQRI